MQGAFIDALVTPVSKLLAEFLPLVEKNCIKTLQINRAFWNSMQAQNNITTESIVSYLKGIRGKSLDTCDNDGFHDNENRNDSDLPRPGAPIPGIPANAQKAGKKKRLTTIIPVTPKSTIPLDPELGVAPITEGEEPHQPKKKLFYQQVRSQMRRLLNSAFCQISLLLATMYALFANDLNLAFGSKEADHVIGIFTYMVLIMFILEIIISTVCVPKYIRFFFWLDLAACISLLLEVDFPLQLGDSPGDLSLAKASRAAKVGARAGRYAKIIFWKAFSPHKLNVLNPLSYKG
jgi:hypothetical protein